jgi:hypothetical protein
VVTQVGFGLKLVVIVLVVFLSGFATQPVKAMEVAADYDVLINGAGMGGISAAFAASDAGKTVGVVDPTDMPGGQATAAGVSNIDCGVDVSSGRLADCEGGYIRELNDRAAQLHGGAGNVHKSYFAGNQWSFSPSVYAEAIHQAVNERRARGQTIDFLFLHEPISGSLGSPVRVTYRNLLDNSTRTVSAKRVVEASEFGDLLPILGVPYRLGTGISPNLNLEESLQDITYALIFDRYDHGVPEQVRYQAPPPGYDPAEFNGFVANVPAPGETWGAAVQQRPWNILTNTAYRGMPDPVRPNSATAATPAGARLIVKTGLNFANDFAVNGRFIEDRVIRQTNSCEAFAKADRFGYHLSLLDPRWGYSVSESYSRSQYKKVATCSNLPAEVQARYQYAPLIPYVREARRMVGVDTLTSYQVVAQKSVNHFSPAAVKQVSSQSAIAVGWYPTDMHGVGALDLTIDHPSHANSQHGPFQVSLEHLVSPQASNLIATEKNISASRVANGATRLQPITSLTGQAAGLLAAKSIDQELEPRDVPAVTVQYPLAKSGVEVSLYRWKDVSRSTNNWPAIQAASVQGLMIGRGELFGPNDSLLRIEAGYVLVRLFQLPHLETEAGVEDTLRRYRLTIMPPESFGRHLKLRNGEVPLFIARGFNQPARDELATMAWLHDQDIDAGCSPGDIQCLWQSQPRSVTAKAFVEALIAIKEKRLVPIQP